MGSTTNPQPGTKCPNCRVESDEAVNKDEDNVGLLECHNKNCAVGRFWGTHEYY